MSAWHGMERRRVVAVSERSCIIIVVAVFIVVEFIYLFGSCNDIVSKLALVLC